MAFVLADRVKETTNAPGTGNANLQGAVLGFQSFAVVGNGNSTFYTIADQVGSRWEVGIGTYNSAGPSLSRDTILASSSGGTAVNFNSGTQDIFITYPAEKSVYGQSTTLVAPTGALLPVSNGGTGAGNLTGYVYGNGTGAMTAATTIPTSSLTGSVSTTNGGTGLTTYTAGDIVYYATGTTLTKLGIGAAGYVLKSDGTAPTWDAVSNVAVTTISFGTTGLTPATATGGAVTVAGTLATGNGGTGLTTFTAANNAIYSTSSSALTAGTLPLAAGGTGATTVSGAQTNLQVDPAGTAVAMAIALG